MAKPPHISKKQNQSLSVTLQNQIKSPLYSYSNRIKTDHIKKNFFLFTKCVNTSQSISGAFEHSMLRDRKITVCKLCAVTMQPILCNYGLHSYTKNSTVMQLGMLKCTSTYKIIRKHINSIILTLLLYNTTQAP